MKIVKEILGRIFALWGLILFFVTLLIVLPIIWAYGFYDEPKSTAGFVAVARRWMHFYLFCIGCPITAKGQENFKEGENYIVLCNHNSLMDVPVSFPEIPGANKTIAKTSFAKTPFFGIIYKRGSVLVDRNSDASRRKSMEDMKKVLARGMHMCIYPEGTRNQTDKPLKEFYEGAFRLAVATKKPIIPGIIFNTRDTLPANKFFLLWPHRLSIHFLPAIPIDDNISSKELKSKVFNIMEEYYVANQKKQI